MAVARSSASAPAPEPPIASQQAVAHVHDFQSLYDEHVDFVWRNLRRLGVAPASLDDAVQDVFLVVHRRLATWEGRSSLRSWLFGVALRVARDHRRSARRKGELDELPEGLANSEPGPLERLEQADALRRLDRALAALDDEKRAVFVMMEVEQMTAPEVAEITGLKLNTVYSRLRLARTELELSLGTVRGEGEGSR